MNANKYIDRLLNESEGQITAEEMAKRIGDGIKETFPESYVRSYVYSGLGKSIAVTFALGKDKTEWANGIINNDPVRISLTIGFDQINKDGTMMDNVTAESGTNSITVKPPEGSYLYCSHTKVTFRKKTASPEKIIQYVIDYFKKLKGAIKENIPNMLEKHADLAKKKV